MDKIKIAIIGCGGNGSGHLRGFVEMSDVDVVAVVDSNPEVLENLKKKYPEIKYYANHREMFDKEELDAVCVSSTHNAHYEHVMCALENNSHVLLEKPMALKEEHAREMIVVAAEKNLIIQVGFECRRSRLYMRIKEIVDSDELGELLSITFTHYRGTWKKDWYCTKEFGGGSMNVIETCHYLDLMRFWSGQDVEWVFASAPKANLMKEYEYPDTTFCQLGFNGGMVASIVDSHARSADDIPESAENAPDGSYGMHEGEYMNPIYGHQFEYTITGSKGSMWVRMFAKQISILERKKIDDGRPKLSLKRLEDYSEEAFYSLVHDYSVQDRTFIENIKNGDTPEFSAEDALKSHLAIYAIEKSEETGEKITVKY